MNIEKNNESWAWELHGFRKPIAKLILLALLRRSDSNAIANITFKDLAKDCNCTEVSVRRRLKELVERGLIVKHDDTEKTWRIAVDFASSSKEEKEREKEKKENRIPPNPPILIKFIKIKLINKKEKEKENKEINKEKKENDIFTTNRKRVSRKKSKELAQIENEKISISFVPKIIDFLNQKTGKNFLSTNTKTRKVIITRRKEGFTLTDFKKVIENQTRIWKDVPIMRPYLRPETLFGNKMESYLNSQTKLTKTQQKVEEHVIDKHMARNIEKGYIDTSYKGESSK